MNLIEENLQLIKKQLPEHCQLVAVSKTRPDEDILKAYNTGHRHFGENKVQELCQKAERLPKDIKWHMIGHLQTNKVKYIASFVHLVHGVDSVKLLKELNKNAAKHQRSIDCLLQVRIAKEETKFGMGEKEVIELLSNKALMNELKNIKIIGLMGMATNTTDEETVSEEFRSLKTLQSKLEATGKTDNIRLPVCSMGMSNDYVIAVEEGSNMVRIGSSIFGKRNYTPSEK